MKKFLNYSITAALVIPAVAGLAAPTAYAAPPTPIDQLPPSSTTTNVANDLLQLEKLMDIRLENRETYFELHYKRGAVPVANVLAHIEDYFTDAMQFKEKNPYMAWAIADWDVEAIDSSDKVTLVFKMNYFANLTEERYVDQQVQQISQKVIKAQMTSFEKALALYDYIIKDAQLTIEKTSTSPQSAYALLQEKRGSSRAFASLYYRLLEHNGIATKILSGRILNTATDLDVDHWWNMVNIDGRWYHVDSALSAGYLGKIKDLPYEYFLLTDASMRATHEWTSYANLLATDTYYEAHRYAKKLKYVVNQRDTRKHKIWIDGFGHRDFLTVDGTQYPIRAHDFYYDEHNDWLYFIGRSEGSYLYKMRIDGSRLQVVSRNQGNSISMNADGSQLYFGSTTIAIERQSVIDAREAEAVSSRLKWTSINASNEELAQLRVSYEQLSPEARQLVDFEARTNWNAIENSLPSNRKTILDLTTAIMQLDELRPNYRQEVLALRQRYDALPVALQLEVYAVTTLQQHESIVQNNLSLALQLDRAILALEIDNPTYQNEIKRLLQRLDMMTYAQQILVVNDAEIFTRYNEIRNYIQEAADFDYRLEVLQENDVRLEQKVRALRVVYDRIKIGEDRNITRYNRLIYLERFIATIDTAVNKLKSDITAEHNAYLIATTPGATTAISDSFVASLQDYRKRFTALKAVEKNAMTTELALLREMESYADTTFRTPAVIAIENEIDKLALDLKEIDKRFTAVMNQYIALSNNEQKMVRNHQKLLELEQGILYKKDINAVIALINRINQADKWAVFKNATYEARFAYDNLNDFAKSKITNYKVLQEAEKRISAGQSGTGSGDPNVGKDVVTVEGFKEGNSYTFELTNDVLNETLSTKGRKDLLLKTASGVTIQIPAGAMDSRLALLADGMATVTVTKDYAVDFSLVLRSGKEKREMTTLKDYMIIKVPTSQLTSDYDAVIVQSAGTEFGAVPFKIDGSQTTITTKTITKYFVREALSEFEDTLSSFYEEEIAFLANRYIVKGVSPTAFKPTNYVTRAQFSLMLARALDLKATQPVSFADVRGKEFEQAVASLQDLSIIYGVTPDYFMPYESLTRQQGLVMMKRMLDALNIPLKSSGYEPYLEDWEQLSAEAQEAYLALEHLELIEEQDGYFKPYQKLTREEMANLLARSLQEAKLY